MIDELLRSNYQNIRFYCHNMGGYDVYFILRVLADYNELNPTTKYELSYIWRDSRLLKLTITKNKNKLTLFDSYPILNDKLSVLGLNFDVANLKSVFPYKFSTYKNLFYIGVKPSIDYYDGISKEDSDNLELDSWSFKDETIKYLNKDLLCLYDVLVKFNKQLFIEYGAQLKDGNTISSLAAHIYLTKFYNNNIPSIDLKSLYNDLQKAYYGGITEVYRPYGENLFYYDVNSLYPYVALNDMPGLICKNLKYFGTNTSIDGLFGFFKCEIETPLDCYLGILPVKTPTGLEYPLGRWEGWYFSEELKFAKENGYKIKVIEGYTFSRESDTFKNYINNIYKKKANAVNKTQKVIAKSLLNNLLGRFGINLEKPI